MEFLVASSAPWCVYMLECEHGGLYTGATRDVARRFQEHLEGRGGRFTRANRPVKLVYREVCATESQAKRREAQIKVCTRRQKLALIVSGVNALSTT